MRRLRCLSRFCTKASSWCTFKQALTSTYTLSNENTLQVGLHQSTRERITASFKEWISPHFNDKDYFVTLTFRSWVKFDEVRCSADIKHFLKSINRKVYGKANIKKGMQLKCFPIFELNHSDGVHVHMMLQKPNDIARLHMPFEALVIETWQNMRCGGVRKAQDITPCNGVTTRIGYQSKQINTADKLLKMDVHNIHLY